MHLRVLMRKRKKIGDTDKMSVDSRMKMYQSFTNVLLKHDSEPLRHILNETFTSRQLNERFGRIRPMLRLG